MATGTGKTYTAFQIVYRLLRSDLMSTFHFYNLYSVFLSIASTLFLSLLTSDFHAIGSITAGQVTKGAWVICIGSGFLGAILACYKVSQKTKNDTSNRDVAVKKVFTQHIQKN